MKAIEKNGVITTYNIIPNTWENENGLHLNFKKANHSDYGFYDVVEPSYTTQTQSLGDIYFDKKKKVFTYKVIETDLSVYNINELKDNKILDIKNTAGDQLKGTDWYIIRKIERNIDVPDSIVTERSNILSKSNQFESELKALSSFTEVLLYTYSF